MDISTSALANVSLSYNAGNSGKTNVSADAGAVKQAVKPESVTEAIKQQNEKDQEMSKEDIEKTTGDLNKIMQLLNADLQFALHEKTQRMMVQLVDVKQQKVLKEFPPHELLDTIAAIKDYIGLLLDKKA